MVDLLADCSDEQVELLRRYSSLLADYNTRVNLVSRKDTDHLFDRHILHSLTLAIKNFPDGATVVDWGTGGGLPAIPLAIRFPMVNFVAVDSTGKKIKAVRSFVEDLGLKNIESWTGRAEEWSGEANYSISRATAKLKSLWAWHKRVSTHYSDVSRGSWALGLICLKGGDLTKEKDDLSRFDRKTRIVQTSIVDYGDVFVDKYIVEVRRSSLK